MPPHRSETARPVPVGAFTHKDKRVNIPTADPGALVSADAARPTQLPYTRNPDLDPQLVWHGKDEQDRDAFIVDAPQIHIQEKIAPRVMIENLRKVVENPQLTLFEDFDGLGNAYGPVEYYQHPANWSNRMILGDSLQVMASLVKRENQRGKVQMVYIDPPYGIKFNSNWQVRAVGGGDGIVRLWDPGDATQVHTVGTLQSEVYALCAVQAGDRTLLAVGGNDGRVGLWDFRTVPSDRGMHIGEDAVQVLCPVQVRDRTLIAVGGTDATVRLWDLTGALQTYDLNIRQGEVQALSEVRAGSRTLLAVGDTDGIVRLWDPADGSQVHTLDTGTRGMRALCAVQAGGRSLFAVGGGIGEMVQLWDLTEGKRVHALDGRRSMPSMLCVVQATDRTLLAAGGGGGTVQLWDPADGSEIRTFDVRQNWVDGMCAVHAGNRALLAIGGEGMVQLWDPADGTRVLTVPVQHSVLALTSVADSLVVGLIVITLDLDFLA